MEEIIQENIEYHNKYGILYQENSQLIYDNQKLKEENQELTQKLSSIWNSRTWKYTKPLRYISHNLRRKTVQKVQTSEGKQLPKHRIAIDKLMKQLETYDVISFDIFDTLILRNINKPTDLFRLVGSKLGIENFESYRVKAEQEARKVIHKKNQEINIYDIYKILEKYIKIDSMKAIEIEFEVEKDFCVCNPYFKALYDKLLEKKKIIIITSDMYWPKTYLIDLLTNCGYQDFKELFVSCEYEENKGSGNLQKIASKKIGEQYTYVHVGDNYLSDIEGSKKNNWKTYYYPKCSTLSEYDTIEHSIVSSINKAIVDNYFYNNVACYNPYFEYGFKYAGLLVCGFCEWLDDFAKKNNIDKFLFLARDMKVVHQVYQEFYNTIPNEYVVISRSAALELNFDEMPEEFIEFYFKPRLNTKETIQSMLIDSDLTILIEELNKTTLKINDTLTEENYGLFKEFIYENASLINDYFKNSKLAAQKYLKEKIGKAKNIAVVDLGWSGQILIQLRHFVKSNINSDINIVGAYIANSNNTKVNYYIESGIMHSYLFSYAQNNNFLLNTAILEENTKAMFLEALFSSEDPTLLKYDLDENQNYRFVYGITSANKELITGVTQGIFAFATAYCQLTKKYKNLKISSIDAYTPFHRISGNYCYNYSIFKDTKEYLDSLPRFSGKRHLTTIGEIIKNRKLL